MPNRRIVITASAAYVCRLSAASNGRPIGRTSTEGKGKGPNQRTKLRQIEFLKQLTHLWPENSNRFAFPRMTAPA
jgi:hypothetical protein